MSMLDARSVHRAREELFETGAVSERLAQAVRPEILASWRRSAAFGAESQVRSLPFNENFGAAERLITVAEPVLRSLAENLTGLHAGVLLSDRNANIVRRWVADRTIAADLDRICSDCGFGAPEDVVGTNGIGTVAELGSPQIVVGPEHYADTLVTFTCVGAPIRNPLTNRLEGIVTLSCRADAANALLTPLIVGTAADIENRLLQSSTLAERCLLDAYLAAKKRHRVVVALNRDTMMAGPRGNRALAALADRDRLWEIALERVGSGPTTVALPMVGGRQTTIEITPVRVDNRLFGFIVVLDGVDHAPVARAAPARPTTEHTSRKLQEALPGDSPRWRSVLEAAARYLSARTPVVIEGPLGAGKWTLATQLAGAVGAPATVVAVDALDLAHGHGIPALAEITTAPDVLLVRHIDQIGPSGTDAVLRMLDRFTSLPWLVATRRSLESTSAAGLRLLERFPYARLELPTLAERSDDIPAIVQAIMASHPNGGRTYLSSDALSELRRATWPGGIRQLHEVVQSLLAARIGEITTDDLPVDVRSSAMQRNLTPIEQLECEAIIQALRDADGNKLVASKNLGISRSTIYRKIRSYGIDCETTFF